jgi:polyhydroxyalkanoate synthesis regulator phasin
MQTAANDLKKKTDLTNPCYGETALGQAKVGAIINANTAWQGNGQVARDLTTPTDFKDSNLNNIQKQQLAILKQDTDIDAQHPLADSNPEVKAYFSDVVNYNGSISPNENKLSRLDEVLDEMVKAGEITEEQKPRIRQLSLDHWTNGTVPTGIFTDKNAEQPTNESMFKIGKLITVR